MLSTAFYETLPVKENELFKKLFDTFDEYYQPYFILIRHELSEKEMFDFCATWVNDHQSILEGADWFEVQQGLMLLTLDSDDQYPFDYLFRLLQKRLDTPLQLAIFRHNCLMSPYDTFKYTAQLLEKVMAESSGSFSVSINDFTDEDNWPGLGEYIKLPGQ